MAGQKIRIRLKSYDHEVIDSSARKIVDTVTRAGATVVGPVPLPTEKNVIAVIRSRCTHFAAVTRRACPVLAHRQCGWSTRPHPALRRGARVIRALVRANRGPPPLFSLSGFTGPRSRACRPTDTGVRR